MTAVSLSTGLPKIQYQEIQNSPLVLTASMISSLALSALGAVFLVSRYWQIMPISAFYSLSISAGVAILTTIFSAAVLAINNFLSFKELQAPILILNQTDEIGEVTRACRQIEDLKKRYQFRSFAEVGSTLELILQIKQFKTLKLEEEQGKAFEKFLKNLKKNRQLNEKAKVLLLASLLKKVIPEGGILKLLEAETPDLFDEGERQKKDFIRLFRSLTFKSGNPKAFQQFKIGEEVFVNEAVLETHETEKEREEAAALFLEEAEKSLEKQWRAGNPPLEDLKKALPNFFNQTSWTYPFSLDDLQLNADADCNLLSLLAQHDWIDCGTTGRNLSEKEHLFNDRHVGYLIDLKTNLFILYMIDATFFKAASVKYAISHKRFSSYCFRRGLAPSDLEKEVVSSRLEFVTKETFEKSIEEKRKLPLSSDYFVSVC